MSIGKFVFAVVIAWCATPAHAATLQQCEKVKLQYLKAEQGSRAAGGKGSKAGGKGPSKRRQSADKLEEWLWKNCSNYAHELRSLEQQRM
jgi:hypothetical protein